MRQPCHGNRALLAERLSFCLQTFLLFFMLRLKGCVHNGAANCVLLTVACVIITYPNI